MHQIRKQAKILAIYFNNQYGGNAGVNPLQFKAMTGHSLSEIETNALERADFFEENSRLDGTTVTNV